MVELSQVAGSASPHQPMTASSLDPVIPPKHQRVSFAAEGQNIRGLMDGKEFARGNSAQWLPWPGRHVLQITDAGGNLQDEIRLKVRGAGLRVSVAR